MQGQKSPEPSAEPQVYVGIDVCKDWLDVHIHPSGSEVRLPNSNEGLRTLGRRLRKLKVGRIVIEATGKFHRLAHRSLHAAGLPVAIVNPLRSRLFAEAIGQLAKTDRIDARMLAVMGQTLAPEAAEPPAEALQALQELLHARAAAVEERTALSNRRGASDDAFLKAELARRLKSLDGHIERLGAEIQKRIAAEPALQRRYEILVSIPGVGPVAAMTLAVGMPELGHCSAKAATLLAGLAPLACDSGNRTGERHIRGGRAYVRTGIYMAAVAASNYNPQFRQLYERLVQAGKEAKVAFTAVMRKIVVLANTLIAENRLWTPLRP